MRKTHIDLLRGYRVTLVHAAEEVSTVLWYGREYAVVNKYLKPITQDVEVVDFPTCLCITDHQNDQTLFIGKDGSTTLNVGLPAIMKNSYSGELVNSLMHVKVSFNTLGEYEP